MTEAAGAAARVVSNAKKVGVTTEEVGRVKEEVEAYWSVGIKGELVDWSPYGSRCQHFLHR